MHTAVNIDLSVVVGGDTGSGPDHYRHVFNFALSRQESHPVLNYAFRRRISGKFLLRAIRIEYLEYERMGLTVNHLVWQHIHVDVRELKMMWNGVSFFLRYFDVPM